jgi:long-subunit fatty acid transport protein
MEVTNDTKKDVMVGFTSAGIPITQFPNKEKIPNNLPAMLSVGAALNLPKVTLSAGYHQYFDKKAKYGLKDANGIYIDNSTLIDKNNNEIALGIEYNVNPIFLISAGYLRTNTGVKETYQTDLSPEQASNSGAIGGALKFAKLLTLNLGVLYTKYSDANKNFTHDIGGNASAPVSVLETYGKDNVVIAVGVDINISK